MTKKAKLYCEAMNTEYKNKCLCKLVKYKKALLNIPAGMDQSPGSYMALELAREQLNSEIERKKKKYWSITKPLLIGLVLVLITFFLSFFFLHNNTNITQQIPQAQPLKQTKDKNEVAPSSNQKPVNPTQPQRKSK